MIDWRKVKIWKTMNDGHLWLTSTMQNCWWNLILVINVDNKNWINIDGCNHPSYSTLAMNDASATGLGKSGHCYLLQRDSLCCWLFVEECQIKETTVAFSCWLELEEKNTDKNAPYKKHGHSGSCCFLKKVSVSLLTLRRRTKDNNALIKKKYGHGSCCGLLRYKGVYNFLLPLIWFTYL